MESKNFSAAGAASGRVVAARIFPDLDLLEGIEEICREFGIGYGQIGVGIGSLRRVAMNYVSTANPGPGEGYTTRLEMEGAFSLLSAQGLVSPAEEEGRLNTHLHIVVSGQHDAVYGGHVEKGTRTLTTTDLFITELTGIAIDRKRDPASGVMLTSFREI